MYNLQTLSHPIFSHSYPLDSQPASVLRDNLRRAVAARRSVDTAAVSRAVLSANTNFLAELKSGSIRSRVVFLGVPAQRQSVEYHGKRRRSVRVEMGYMSQYLVR
jgi:hypothetical protein